MTKHLAIFVSRDFLWRFLACTSVLLLLLLMTRSGDFLENPTSCQSQIDAAKLSCSIEPVVTSPVPKNTTVEGMSSSSSVGVLPDSSVTQAKATLAKTVSTADNKVGAQSGEEAVPGTEDGTVKASTTQDAMVEGRIQSIGKMLELTVPQKERLKEKFLQELKHQPAESLDEILGSENANFYRNQVKSSFLKAQDVDTEKDVLYLGRSLGLDSLQEQTLREAIFGVERSLDAQFGDVLTRTRAPGTMQERVARLTKIEKTRQELLNNAIKAALTAEQYEKYLAQQVNSTAGDFVMWHDSGK